VIFWGAGRGHRAGRLPGGARRRGARAAVPRWPGGGLGEHERRFQFRRGAGGRPAVSPEAFRVPAGHPPQPSDARRGHPGPSSGNLLFRSDHRLPIPTTENYHRNGAAAQWATEDISHPWQHKGIRLRRGFRL